MTSGISLTGYSSGIDTAAIVKQLMMIERRPVDRLEQKNANRQRRLAIYSDLRSKLSTLMTAVDSLNTIRDFSKFSATTSDTDDEHFTVAADSMAQATVHTIRVNQLAVAEKEISQGFAELSSEIATGAFKVTVGSTLTEIEIDSSNSTLEGLRDAINNSDAEVTASIMDDGDASTPYRLVITSGESGTANAISIDTSEMSGGTIPVFTDGAGGTPGQQAQNAEIIFNGVSVVSSTNEIEDIVTGIDINLKRVDTGTDYTINIESNIESIMEEINTFTSTYNEIISYLNAKMDDTTVDRDAAFGQIKRGMQRIIYSSFENGGAYSALSQIGFSTTSTGSLTLDETKLEDALESDFDDVLRLMTAYGATDNSWVGFSRAGENTQDGTYEIVITGVGDEFGGTIGGYEATAIGSTILTGAEGTPVEGLTITFSGSAAGTYGNVTYSAGVMQQFYALVDQYVDSVDGLITNKEKTINQAIRYTEGQIERKEENLLKTELRLTAQFTQMEMILSRLQSQSIMLNSISSLNLF